jgi:hypothetical protein
MYYGDKFKEESEPKFNDIIGRNFGEFSCYVLLISRLAIICVFPSKANI